MHDSAGAPAGAGAGPGRQEKGGPARPRHRRAPRSKVNLDGSGKVNGRGVNELLRLYNASGRQYGPIEKLDPEVSV